MRMQACARVGPTRLLNNFEIELVSEIHPAGHVKIPPTDDRHRHGPGWQSGLARKKSSYRCRTGRFRKQLGSLQQETDCMQHLFIAYGYEFVNQLVDDFEHVRIG